MCGSGMKATMLAHDNILAGTHEVMVAGGMESMTNAPYIIPSARQGYSSAMATNFKITCLLTDLRMLMKKEN